MDHELQQIANRLNKMLLRRINVTNELAKVNTQIATAVSERNQNTIKRMYERFSLIVKKGEDEFTIEYLTGVHQGDNLAPLLFVLVFQAAMESLEETEERKKIKNPKYRFFPNTAKGPPPAAACPDKTQNRKAQRHPIGCHCTSTIARLSSPAEKMPPALQI